MPIIHVTDIADPRLAAYREIKERDLVGRERRFIVEGKVTLGVLIEHSRFAVESVFLAEGRLGPLEGLLGRLPEETPVYAAPQAVMDGVAGFAMHRGVLACGLKGGALAPEEALAGARTVVMAAGISNHDNVGAIFRNAAAFGTDAVILDEGSCDPLYRKSIRVSAGAALWLPFVQGGAAGALVEAVKAAGFEVWAMTPRAEAEALTDLERPERLAVLLGAEGPGLPEELIAAARPVRIPMAAGFDSVNVATAGAIALAHAFAR